MSLTSKYFPSTDDSNTPASSSQAEGAQILRGGILLRSVRRASDAKVISGPSLLVDEILRLSGASKIADLVSDIWENDISVFPHPSESRRSTMRLVRIPSPSLSRDEAPAAQPRIYRSPRIGLDISHPSISPSNLHTHPRVLFVGQSYRFFIHPSLLTANGRGQTFLGVYDAVSPDYHPHDAELPHALEQLTGWKSATVNNCWAEYMAGLNGSRHDGKKGEEVMKQWMGRRGKGVASSMTGWLRLIGTLRRVLKDAGTAAVTDDDA